MKKDRSLSIFVYSVIAVCTLIFALIQFFPESLAQAERAVLFGAYYKPFILSGEWYRLLSVGLVHISFMHLVTNMYSLYLVSPIVHSYYGMKGYLAIFLASLLGGSLFQLFLADNTIAVGLSGALYGLMAAYFYMIYRTGAYRIPAIRNGLIHVIVINVLINFIGSVAVMAHLGGFVTGLLVAFCVNGKHKDVSFHRNARIALVIYVAVLGYMTSRIPPLEEIYPGSDIAILRYEYQHGMKNHARKVARNLDQLYDLDNILEIAITGGK